MNVRERIREVDWKNFLVGFMASLLLAPVLSPYVTTFYVVAGVPGHTSPNLEASVKKVDTIYTEGMRVEKFGNLTWESGYEVYRVQFQHSGGPKVDQAIFEVRFPGCVEAVDSPTPNFGNGEITVTSPLVPEIQATERPDSEVNYCTAQISTSGIHEHEGYTLEFVIDHTPNRCDLLTGYNPNKEFFVEYEWYEGDARISDRIVGDVKNAKEEYANIKLPPNSTKLIQKEDYHAYLFGVGNGNKTKALNECYS